MFRIYSNEYDDSIPFNSLYQSICLMKVIYRFTRIDLPQLKPWLSISTQMR